MTQDLFNKLDAFIEQQYLKPVITEDIDEDTDLFYNGEWEVDRNTGKITSTHHEVNDFIKNIDFSNKTHIPYSSKSRALHRIQKWINYDYYEVRNYNMIKFIDDLKLERDISSVSKKIFIDEYNKLRTRGKIKLGLVAYSIFKASVILKKDYDIDKILELLDINYNHYNNAVDKLKEDKIFIPKDINKYYNLVDCYLDKNTIIIKYNDIKNILDGYNSKTILIATIYLLLKKSFDIEKTGFMKHFNINVKTLSRLLNEIKENKIKL